MSYKTFKSLINPAKLINEKQRLKALKAYDLLDTIPERDYDNITKLTAMICDSPVAIVALLDSDRIFFKSHFGTSINEIDRENSFCSHAILETKDFFIVEDARMDERFKNNPLVNEMGAVFYAGVRLDTAEGLPMGMLCILDSKPRQLTELEKQALSAFAYQVMKLFEARKYNRSLIKVQKELKERNEELKNFAGVVSHDMKMPLANMILTADILRSKYGSLLDDQGRKYLDYIKQSSFTLNEYISGLLEHYEADKTVAHIAETFDVQELLEDIIELLNISMDCEINLPEKNMEMRGNKSALEQIWINLISNSIKYNDKERIHIKINCCQTHDAYYFSIEDNGMGISEEDLPRIFDLFSTSGTLDRNGNKGNGIGLSTVKKLLTKLNGDIEVSSTLGVGTTIKFYIGKNEKF